MSSMLASTLRRVATQPVASILRPAAMSLRRGVSTEAPKSTSEKTFKQAWLSDKGAWPVLGVIGFAVSFVTYWSISTLLTNPDVRIDRTARGSVIRKEVNK